jgi:hypothetical protein
LEEEDKLLQAIQEVNEMKKPTPELLRLKFVRNLERQAKNNRYWAKHKQTITYSVGQLVRAKRLVPKGTSTTLPLAKRPKTTGKEVDLYPYLGHILRVLQNGQYAIRWSPSSSSQLGMPISKVNGRHLKPVHTDRPDFLLPVTEPDDEDSNYLLRIEIGEYGMITRTRRPIDIFL